MSNHLLSDYLTEYYSDYLKESNRFFDDSGNVDSGNDSNNGYEPEMVAQLIAGLLVGIEKIDLPLLSVVCSDFHGELSLFFSGQGFDRHDYTQMKVVHHIHNELVSSTTRTLTPVKDDLGNISYEQKSVSLSSESLSNFIDTIPELNSLEYVYDLPRKCFKHLGKISALHPLFSSAEHATKEKVVEALIWGYGVESDASGLLTSPRVIAQFGLSHNHVLAVCHNSAKPDNCYPPEGEPLRFLKGMVPENASPQLPSILAITSVVSSMKIDHVRAEVLAGKHISEYMPAAVADVVDKIKSSESLRAAVSTATRHLKKLALTHQYEYDEASDNPFGGLITYAISITSILESLVKRYDSELGMLLQSSDKSTFDYHHVILSLYRFLDTTRREILTSTSNVSHVKLGLASLSEYSFSNLSEAISEIFNDDNLPLVSRINAPVQVINSYLPDSFKSHLLKKGLSPDFALLTVGSRSSNLLKSYSEIDFAADSVIDYLIELERQHPGLIFKVGSINNKRCEAQGITFVDINFNDEFAASHFCVNTSFPALANYFKARLMNRLTNELTLKGMHELGEILIDAPAADVSFLKGRSI